MISGLQAHGLARINRLLHLPRAMLVAIQALVIMMSQNRQGAAHAPD